MNEASLTTQFAHWVSENKERLTPFVFEAKMVRLAKKKSLGLSEFKPHQIPNLLKASDSGLYWKIPDLGSLNPFDGFFFRGNAYVVIFWYEPRKLKLCTVIDVWDFVKHLDETGKKSIRQKEAEKIAEYCFEM